MLPTLSHLHIRSYFMKMENSDRIYSERFKNRENHEIIAAYSPQNSH